MAEDRLLGQLKASRNLVDIALLLIQTDNRHLLPTVLELLCEQVQQIVDENCVLKKLED